MGTGKWRSIVSLWLKWKEKTSKRDKKIKRRDDYTWDDIRTSRFTMCRSPHNSSILWHTRCSTVKAKGSRYSDKYNNPYFNQLLLFPWNDLLLNDQVAMRSNGELYTALILYVKWGISCGSLVDQTRPSSPRTNLHPTQSIRPNVYNYIETTFTTRTENTSEDRMFW